MESQQPVTTDYESFSSLDSTHVLDNLRRNLTSLTLHDVLEVLFSVAIFALSYIVPEIWKKSFDWERPLPYQQLEDGEVVLDLGLSYPLEGNTVSSNALIWTTVAFPIIALMVAGFVFGPRHDGKAMVCVSFVTFGLNFLITHTLKEYCGRFRPNFYQMCQFSEDTLQCASESEGSISNAHHSFPSGHSSTAFSGMTLLTLAMMGKLALHGNVDTVRHMLIKKVLSILAILPILYATFVAASRVHDFMHHPSDVAVGAAIGFCCANFAYFTWYPSVYSASASGIPLQLIQERRMEEIDTTAEE